MSEIFDKAKLTEGVMPSFLMKKAGKMQKKRRIHGEKILFAVLIGALMLGTAGCGKKKEESKPTTSSSAKPAEDASSEEVSQKTAVQAGGKGNKNSDVPLIISSEKFGYRFNPFESKLPTDQQIVDFTQLRLLSFDREGALIRRAIKGEERQYNGEKYTYQGPANIRIKYDLKKKCTTYDIRLKKGIVFGDGEEVTIDDVIFSMYAFADPAYNGGEKFGELDIVGLAKYRRNYLAEKKRESTKDSRTVKQKLISGIKKISNYHCTIDVKGYSLNDIQKLNIPICPLHVYGAEEKFNYELGKVGFDTGDMDFLTKKKENPMGAGPYLFVKQESGIVYYEANGNYYKGCPKTAFLQIKENKKQKIKDRVEMLTEGDVNVAVLPSQNLTLEQLMQKNSNEKVSGNVTTTFFEDGQQYTYIGINAKMVCVENREDSTRSKNLRKAIAVLLASNRNTALDMGNQTVSLINYPASETSWAVPQQSDEEYRSAFSTDSKGNMIYNSNMSVQERSDAACNAALQYLKLAGYTVKKGRVTGTPSGAGRIFRVYLSQKDGENEAFVSLLSNAKVLFKKIGLQLILVRGVEEEQYDSMLKQGKMQLWCGYENTSVNGELMQMFHTKGKSEGKRNYFHINDSDLDDYIESTHEITGEKKSIELYEKCYDKVMDWAVMVPFYQEKTVTAFLSTEVNMNTVSTNETCYYDWKNEIQNLQMKD